MVPPAAIILDARWPLIASAVVAMFVGEMWLVYGKRRAGHPPLLAIPIVACGIWLVAYGIVDHLLFSLVFGVPVGLLVGVAAFFAAKVDVSTARHASGEHHNDQT